MKISQTPIEEFATTAPITVEPHERLNQAKHLMSQNHVHHIPVMDGSQILGILTDRDLKLACAVHSSPNELTVKDAFNTNAFKVDASTTTKEVIKQLLDQKIGSAIITKAGILHGVFTLTDAARLLLMRLEEEN